MQFTFDGQRYELPKVTMSARRAMDRADRLDGEQAIQARYEVVREVFGEDADGFLGGESLDDIDLTALAQIYAGLQVAQANASLQALDVDKLVRAADAIRAVGEAPRRGFNRVK